MSTGKKIKQFRKDKGMSQKQLSQETGIAEITIRQYEAEKYQPKIDKLRIIAAALGVYIGELDPDWSQIPFDDIEDDLKRDLSLDEQGILQDYRTLNETGKDEACKRINELTEIPKYQKDK